MSLSNQPLPPPGHCDSFRERIELFCDGELTGSENLRFLTHLKECDDCAGWWSDEQTISEILLTADLPKNAPAEAAVYEPFKKTRGVFSASPASPIGHLQRQALVAVAAAILTLVCTIPFWTRSDAEPITNEVVAAQTGLTVALTSGTLRMKPVDGDWREVQDGDLLQEAVSLETSSDALAILDMGGRGSLLLEPATSIQVSEFDGASHRVVLDVKRGKIKLDSDELRVCGTASGVGFSSWSSAYAVVADGAEADILVVERGSLAVRLSDGTALVLHDGDELRADGTIRSGISQIEGLRAILSQESKRVEQLNARLNEAEDANGTLQSQVALLQSQLIEDRAHQDALNLPLSVDEIVESYLIAVSRMNSVSVERPDGFALGVADELRDRGLEGVLALQSAFRSTLDSREQTAICVALGCLGGQGAVELLKGISREYDGSIRRASVLALERQVDQSLGDHFLMVHRFEGSSALGVRCLQAAAQHGASEGVTRLLSLVQDSSASHRAQGYASASLEQLSPTHPQVFAFFKAYAAGWEPSQSGWILYHAVRTIRTAEDTQCIPILRALLRRGLPDHANRYVEAALEALGMSQL